MVIRFGDAPRERTIAPGEVQTFDINLAARDMVRVKVDQGDINLGVSIRGTDRQELAAANNSMASDVEFVSAIVPTTGVYSIEVITTANAVNSGTYTVSILHAGPASAKELALVEGDRLFTQANTRRSAGTAQANRDAMEGFAAARDRYLAADESWRVAESWNRIGMAQLALNQYQDSLVSFEATRVVVDRIGDRRWQGVLLNNIGLAHWNLSEVSAALAAYQEALVIRREVGDKSGEASTLYNTALVYTGIGEPDKAVTLLEQTLPLRRLLGDKAGEVRSLNVIASASRAMGDFEGTFDNLTKALGIVKEQKNKAGEVEALRSMASTYLSLGDLAQARQLIDAAIAEGQPLGDRRVLNLMQSLSADILAADGDSQGALERLLRVRAEHRSLGNRIDELGALTRITRLQLRTGDLEGARAGATEAMAIASELNALGGIGNAFELAGSIALAEKQPTVSASAFREALAIYIKVDDHAGQANARYGLARALQASGHRDEALTEADEALAQIELIRVSVRNAELRTAYRERSQRFYELKVDLLMEKHDADPAAGFGVAALVANDSSRARSLLESFGGNLPEFVQDVDPALLADRERKGRRVNELERRRTLAQDGSRIGTTPAPAELLAALREYRDTEAKVFASSPRGQALLSPPSISRETLVAAAGTDSVIVEYALGESRSFAWTVSTAGITSVVLPPRAAIQDVAARLYRATTARNIVTSDATIEGRRARLSAADRESTEAARALAKLILDPLAAQLTAAKRLVFVVDGSLSTVPFALLPLRGRRLTETHALALLPSATLVTALRQSRKPNAGTVAVFADPVFESADPRVLVRGIGPHVAPSVEPVISSLRGANGRFGRLRFSRTEADAIASMVPRNNRYSALDFSANRPAVQQAIIKNARIVHFATHGIVNAAQPDLSGLVLSLVEATGKSQDGFLRLHDIYRLQLRADLIVLSSCRSAIGKDFKGEGPMALTRGFLVAGAPRVVATLWDVDDRATAELMRLFYAGVLQRHEAPAAALRSAQMALSKSPQWSAPYFWAGFTLTGEWR